MTPLGAPGREIPEDAWVRIPKSPGLYWIRVTRPDGTKSQPAFAIVTPTGPIDTYAMWVWTPNFDTDSNHESWMNYFVTDDDPSLEYALHREEIVVRDDDGNMRTRPVFFEIGERVIEEKG